MTHFPARRDALQRKAEESIENAARRVCEPCGVNFVPKRPWHQQCSPRCRQRAYIQRHASVAASYYGA